MCVYIYIYVCVCVCVCIYISIYEYIHVYLCKYLCVYTYVYINLYMECLLMAQETKGSIIVRIIPKTQKMVLDTSLLYSQHDKVQIKSKVEQSKERSSILSVIAIEKIAFKSPSTMVANFTYICVCISASHLLKMMSICAWQKRGLLSIGY